MILMVLPLTSAFGAETVSSDDVLVIGLDETIDTVLNITNSGQATTFEFFNLVGFSLTPSERISFSTGESREIELSFSPIGDFDYRGFYTVNYFIRNAEDNELQESITFEVIDLKDIFEVGSGEVDPDSQSIQIYLKNLEDVNVGEVTAKFSSAFFEFEKTFNLGADGKVNFEVQLDKNDFNKLMAGFYNLNVEINTNNQDVEAQGIIQFIEKDVLTISNKSYGFIINTQIIEKINEGNLVATSETVIRKNVFSRLFTTFSPEPEMVDRQGFSVFYTWRHEISPGEIVEIAVKTNWFYPFIIILFIIVIVILAKLYSDTHLVLRKKVSFVKTKGGEFALKVTIIANAKKYIERVNVIDRLPSLVKIYERFGGEQPAKINQKLRRVEYHFEKLEEGETRVMSYIIYSKIGVMGRFALPSATAIFDRDGKIKEAESNKAFFVAEQRSRDIEEN